MAASKSRYKTNLGKALASIANDMHVLGNFMVADPSAGANPKYDIFKQTGIRRKEGLANNAVSVAFERPQELSMAQLGRYNPYGSIFYSSLNDNKAGRLYEYRLMAGYSEVLNALENICNEFISLDDKGQVATFTYTKPSASVLETTTLNEEFQYFTKLFNFEEKGFNYCWKFLTEGELFLELIVNDSRPENIKEGILGVVDISAELVDTIWKSKNAMIIDSFIGRRPVYDPNDPNKLEKIELVPYQANQLFYVCSGKWDSEGEFMVPFIERARRRYIQLSYIEDAIVIYRLVRAPERLVFTVPTGNMAPYDAERYMKSLMDQYWKTKVMDVNTGDITQKYNPQSMTDAYYFSKPQGGEAISVSQLKGGDNLGELQDLDFFLKALYRDLKVPSSFLNPEKNASTDASQILVEELRFADFITSIQKTFAGALKQAFITHLKFKGLWSRYKMHENHLEIKFNQPSSYYLMRELQLTQMRNDIFNSISGNEMISKIYALKKYFKWSDKEILANISFLKTEAALLWEIQQRREYGPTWKNVITGQNQEGSGGGMGGGMDFGGGGMGGGGMPDFGGGGGGLPDLGGGGDLGGGDMGGDAGGEPPIGSGEGGGGDIEPI
jgi:hypothetical protein